MEQKILAFLKMKLVGLQEAFLQGVSKEYAKTITDETLIETTLNDGVLNVLKFSAGQLQAEGDRRAATAQKTALDNWRKEHNLDENGKPIEVKVEPPKVEGQPDIAKLIADALKPLMEKVNSFELEKATTTRSSILSEAVKDVPASIKAKVLKDFGRMNFTTDEEFTSYLEETKTDLAGIIQTDANNNLAGMQKPFTGGTPVPAQQTIAEIKAWSEKNKEVKS
jgi:hypothetical protein